MPSTREIRRRIKSVKNTQQITRALQMVSASKMPKAQTAARAGREYSTLLTRVLVSLRERVSQDSHPLLEDRPVNKELIILISTNKGLCGALNTNLFRETSRLEKDRTEFISSGRKGAQYLARTRRAMLAEFEVKELPTLAEVRPIAQFALEKFLNREVDKVTVAYTRFVNTLNQKPTLQTLLPISPDTLPEGMAEAAEDRAKLKGTSADPENGYGYLFVPDDRSVLDAILPEYVYFSVYQMILNARASEHSARMVAMKNATDNAKTLIKDLTLEYNKVRQAAITTELLEITTAQMAVG